MEQVKNDLKDSIETLTLQRGRVNALNESLIQELTLALQEFESNPAVKAIILTGQGKFFSFGFDIPEFTTCSRDAFTEFVTHFTDLYSYMFMYPKPIIAALNGHTIAGGCMLALACDFRLMVTGTAKISLNEIGFGSSVFAGATEMLRFWVGSARATEVLYSGAMYPAEEALRLGLVQEIASEANLADRAIAIAAELAAKYPPAFASIKSLLRKPVADEMARREKVSINEFADIWYSEHTWANLQNIKIHQNNAKRK